MSKKNPRIAMQGQCLCGAVKVNAASVDTGVGACHCSMCRQWGGGPFLAVDAGSEVELSGNEHIGVFNSSEWAERGFCKECGTHLFYRLKQNQQHIMPIGLFGETEQLVLDHQVFIDEKPEYYCFSQNTKDITGAEVFAMFGAN